MGKKIEKQSNSGITLIALVITIIVLIILASVSINLLLGENGILRRSKTAAMEYKISDYIEKVELARGKVSIDHEGVAPLDDLINQIYEDKIVPEGSITKLSDEVAEMVTPEGYIFIITADKTEYIGKGKGLEGNLIIGAPVWDATTHTASVTIIKGSEIDENLVVEYQINGYTQGWETGTTVNNLKHNDVLYTRLSDGTTAGQYTVRVIKDTLEPQDASIELSGVPAGTNSTATAKVTLIDKESGVDISKCKWTYTDEETEIGLNPDDYNNSFENLDNPQELSLNRTTSGTYYLHILTQDIAGNRKETISEAIPVNIWITNIALNKTSTTIYIGATETLTVSTLLPEEATNKELKWSSSNTGVATVVDGVVTAKAAGNAVITVSAQDGSGKSATCTVTVKKQPYYLFNNGATNGVTWELFGSIPAGETMSISNGAFNFQGTNASDSRGWKTSQWVNLAGYTKIHAIISTGSFYTWLSSFGVAIQLWGGGTNGFRTCFDNRTNGLNKVEVSGNLPGWNSAEVRLLFRKMESWMPRLLYLARLSRNLGYKKSHDGFDMIKKLNSMRIKAKNQLFVLMTNN